MTVYNFRPVKYYASKKGHCPKCGKATIRRRTFEQTVSPFNRNEDGTERTPEEVRAAVKAEADAWQPDFWHNDEICKPS